MYGMQFLLVLHCYLYTLNAFCILDNIPMPRLRQAKKWALEGMHSQSSPWRAIRGRNCLLQDGYIRLVVCECGWYRETHNLWIHCQRNNLFSHSFWPDLGQVKEISVIYSTMDAFVATFSVHIFSTYFQYIFSVHIFHVHAPNKH